MSDKCVLNYYLPKPDRPHTILHVPESHTLYVGPLSCTRRHSIHALKYGDRNNISFLFITETDVISGSYEDQIVSNIGKLVETLEPSPHIFFIAVFCIDDFLGTDEDALIQRLEVTYPNCRFVMEHVDPVSLDDKVNMATKKTTNIYSFIDKSLIHDNGINFIGHFTSLEPDCEFLGLLKEWGVTEIREIFHCRTYEEYQNMGRSRLNVILRFMGERSAREMEKCLEIPYYSFTTEYIAERVAKGYSEIADILGAGPQDFSRQIEEVKKDAEETVKILNGLPVAVDSSGSIVTFALARAMLHYGFNLKYVFRSSHKFKINVEDEEYITYHCPHITVTRAGIQDNLYKDTEETECLAIGCEGARVLRASHYVDMWHDEGYFGFHGIHRLFREMREAALSHTDWSRVPELKIARGEK